jgi:hypothetical protein
VQSRRQLAGANPVRPKPGKRAGTESCGRRGNTGPKRKQGSYGERQDSLEPSMVVAVEGSGWRWCDGDALDARHHGPFPPSRLSCKFEVDEHDMWMVI